MPENPGQKPSGRRPLKQLLRPPQVYSGQMFGHIVFTPEGIATSRTIERTWSNMLRLNMTHQSPLTREHPLVSTICPRALISLRTGPDTSNRSFKVPNKKKSVEVLILTAWFACVSLYHWPACYHQLD